MFNRLFKPKWQHSDPLVRLKAIEELNQDENSDCLVSLAGQDLDSRVRKAALLKIERPELLEKLLSETGQVSEWVTLAEHIVNTASTLKDSVIVDFHRKKSEWKQSDLLSQLTQSESTELIEMLLSSSTDDEMLVNIACQAKPVQLRIWAVERAQSSSILQKIVKAANHKQVIQLARKKLNDRKAEEAAEQASRAAAEKLCRSLKKLANTEWSEGFQAQLDIIKSKWNSLDHDLVEEWFITYDKSLAKCKVVIEKHRKELDELAQVRQLENEQAKLIDEVLKLTQELEQESLSNHIPSKDALTLVEKNWSQFAAETKINPKYQGQYEGAVAKISRYLSIWDRFEEKIPDFFDLFEGSDANDYQALKHWQSDWKKLVTNLAWPEELATPKLLVDWQNQAAEKIKEFNKIRGEQQKQVGYLSGKIKLLRKHIKDKNLIAANKMLNYLHFKKQPLIGEFLSDIESKLNKTVSDLEELRDWHAFATGPKKENLCEQMESLIDDEIAAEPVKLANKIRELQEQWHQLIASDADADNELWDRFKQATDKAYLPCIEFYKQQDKTKAENLAKRLEICESLELLFRQTDWQQANWKDIDKKQQAAIKSWRQYAPVPNNEHKPAQKRFDKINESIRELLNAEKQKNLELREALVAKAERLSKQDDIAKAIEFAKQLQQEWKELGFTFYKADKAQWQLFRKALDVVFAKRDQEKQAFFEELNANKASIEQITKQIKALVQLEDTELKSSFEEFDSLRQSWDRKTGLPRNKSNQLNREFQKACDDYLNHFNGLENRLLQQNLSEISDIENKLVEWEFNEANNATQELETLVQQSRLTEKVKSILGVRINGESTDSSSEELQKLILRAEILVGAESPEEYKQQRMAMQLEQLQQGIAAKDSASRLQKQVLDIYYSWLGLKQESLAEYQQLKPRLEKVFKHVGLVK